MMKTVPAVRFRGLLILALMPMLPVLGTCTVQLPDANSLHTRLDGKGSKAFAATAVIPPRGVEELSGSASGGGGEPEAEQAEPAIAAMANHQPGKITVIPAKAGGIEDSLWERLVDGFDLDDDSAAGVEKALSHYIEHFHSTRKMLDSAKPYLWEIVEAVESREMPMELALLPAVESRFNPMARSHRRARGLWQFMPGTANHMGLGQNWWFDARLDVTESTHAALNYLNYLHGRFHDWPLAIAAYNCGEARLQRAIDNAGGSTDFRELDLPAETRQYLPRLLALAELIREHENYGISLPDMPDQQRTDTVLFERQVDLALAARYADTELQTLQYLNPALLRWATPPDGPHRLRIPAGKSRQLQQAMAEIAPHLWTDWQSYLVREGDDLGTLAQRFGIRVVDLKSINNLNGSLIPAGQSLMLPTRSHLAALQTEPDVVSLQPPENAKRVEYQIEQGDTLWDIARMFKVSVDELSGWNGLSTSSILRPGKMLVVWVSPETGTTQLGNNPLSAG